MIEELLKEVCRAGRWLGRSTPREGRGRVGLNRISDSENFERETSATIK